MFSNIKLIMVSVVAAFVLSTIGWLYWQNTQLSQENDVLSINNATLESAHQLQSETISTLEFEIDKREKVNKKIAHEKKKIEEERDEANAKLNGFRSRLSTVGKAKPKIVERLSNRAISNIMHQFHEATGG